MSGWAAWRRGARTMVEIGDNLGMVLIFATSLGFILVLMWLESRD